MQKPGTPSSMPTKTIIFNWIKQIAPQINSKMKVQDLGDGVLYCKIINHYFPGSINVNRLNQNPKNQYEYSLNLKLFQNALTSHKINVPFDVGKISKQKFLQNWALINSLYKSLVSSNQDSFIGQDSKSLSYVGSKYTPKRTFEVAFSNQHYKLPQVQTFLKPTYNHSQNQPIVHYQNNQLLTSTSNVQTSSNSSINHASLNHPPNQFLNSNSTQTQSIQPINSNLLNQNYQHGNQNTNHGTNLPTTNNHHYANGNNMNNNNLFGGLTFGMHNNIANLTKQTLLSRQSSQNNQIQQASVLQSKNLSSLEQQLSNKCWSVGKLPSRQSLGFFNAPSQQNSGKYSVNSHIFQSNYNAVIDRVKQILLKNSHDIQKIRQIKMLLNIPLNQDIVKIQEEQNIMINCSNINKNSQSSKKETKHSEIKNSSKETIQGSKENIEILKSSSKISNYPEKLENNSKSLSNNSSGLSVIESSHKKQTISFNAKISQSSGKKIKNNFFGQGSMFRK